jgi:hypothetical protein
MRSRESAYRSWLAAQPLLGTDANIISLVESHARAMVVTFCICPRFDACWLAASLLISQLLAGFSQLSANSSIHSRPGARGMVWFKALNYSLQS